ncbi:MAG: hypothetical protein MUC69_10790 [Gemmatimonadales bacterium]|jgi:hypothetical protein|nr:hypothetical protein [Gemmatimonadales bacterium]
MTSPHRGTARDAGVDANEALIRRVVEQVERTFETEGRAAALAAVTDLLRRLEPATLHVLAQQRETEAEELERER